MAEKTLILFFNGMWGQPPDLKGLDLPLGCEFTTDTGRIDDAAAVVFHIPELPEIPARAKRPGQIRVAWSMECEAHYPWMADPAYMRQFDLTMTYRLDADVPVTYLPGPETGPRFTRGPGTKENLAALFMSGSTDNSGRTEYARQLMRHLEIHSFGSLLRNRHLESDRGRETKLSVISGYKFTLCFENAIARDYVTEKFFDPLAAGSVPVYLGAPNIETFAPGDGCFIDIRNFEAPGDLAAHLTALDRDDAAYESLHSWREKPLRDIFVRLRDGQREPAFVRLCREVKALRRRRQGQVAGPSALSGNRREPQHPAAGPGPAIPKIIHQTWKDRNIPEELAGYCRSWQTHHPDWEYRLWTDADNREFLARHHAWFLPVYDRYPSPIMRADAVRYFILFHFGGVYADLDAECLCPLDPLLAGKQLVLGLEHPAHLATPLARERSLTRILGNAVMASAPGHPFWEALFKRLVGCHRHPGPLDATGPYMLTRAWEAYANKQGITVEPHDRFYPIDNETPLAGLPEPDRDRIRRTAHTVHHWMGSWWKKADDPGPRKLSLMSGGGIIDISLVDIQRFKRLSAGLGDRPLVSCLMVTRDRPGLAMRAVQCFRNQTWDNRELIIIDDGPARGLADRIQGLGDDRIAFYAIPDRGECLGDLRNLAVEKARGGYIAQWDDDDLSDPERLEIQMAVIRVLKTHACFLERHRIWWPESRRMAFSTKRIWEGSFVCRREKLPPYPALEKGEDTPAIRQIAQEHRIAVLDHPRLYTYVFHGRNTFDADHWEAHWTAATRTFEGDAYESERRLLETGISLDFTDLREPVRPEQAAAEASTHQGPEQETPVPDVLILIPVKDAAPFLPRLLENLKSLTFPRQHISLAFLESDSRDNTHAAIQDELPGLNRDFARARLFKRDFGFRSGLPRWKGSIQYRRRSILAKSRNYLLSKALGSEDWVLWLDADVCRIPADLIQQLLAADKDIVVPNCLCADTGGPFDLNSFKFKPGAETLDLSPYLKDGIYQPPKGFGRHYLTDLRDRDWVRLDGVGGTALLVRADRHREGLVFPSFSFQGYIETEGLAMMARDMGFTCWGLPNLEIFHP